jgi:glutathione S-transferase
VTADHDRELIMWKGSPYSVRALAALHVKGFARPSVDYRLSEAPGDIETRMAMLPAPHTVPVLRWDGEVITGSDICAFLDSRTPGEAALYPEGCADEVRRLEGELAVIFWYNGWLSVVDPEGFERFAGAVARSHISSGAAGAAAKFAARLLPKRVMGRIVSSAVSNDFVKRMRERGAEAGGPVGEVCGSLAEMKAPRDTAKVLEEARAVLLRLDAELQRSSTPFFCDAASPTAADLTLYGMLERWLGDCLCPGAHGASQPSIADGMPGLQACWEAMRERFRPDLELHDLRDYHDLEAPVGPATWPCSS